MRKNVLVIGLFFLILAGVVMIIPQLLMGILGRLIHPGGVPEGGHGGLPHLGDGVFNPVSMIL